MKVMYDPGYVGGADFATTRKAALVATQVDQASLVSPTDAYDEAEASIGELHWHKYVNAVRTGRPRRLAEASGLPWDDTTYSVAVWHTAGMIAAARDAIETGCAASLSSGMHHAAPDRGDGFCTFNGVALAVADLFRQRGINRVLVLDVDAHCGGGTNKFWGHSDSVVLVDVSTNPFDSYHGRFVRVVDSDEEYRSALHEAFEHADHLGPFDAMIYNAGVDTVDDGVLDPAGLAARDADVAAWVAGRWPTVVCLAGGYPSDDYTLDEIAAMHATTIATFAATAM